MSADRVRVDVESRSIGNVASGVIRHNGDVIAYLFVLRKTCLRIERIAHRNVGCPCQAGISAVGIKQLRIDVVRSIARVVPHHINAPGQALPKVCQNSATCFDGWHHH